MSDLITKASIKKRISGKGFNTAAASMDRFDELLSEIIDTACERAEKNNRKTVMPQDI